MINNESPKNKELNTEDFNRLRDALNSARKLMAYYECAVMEIETKFKVLNTQFSMNQDYNPIETIKTRVKSPESIIGKLERRHLPMEMEVVEKQIYDIAGVRVICPFIEDIYVLADCLLEQDDVRLIEIKDYIKHPKDNGYRSLHLIVEIPIFLQNEKRPMKVEIQLRTIAMDFWASLEHRIRYKKNVDSTVAKQIAAELKECAEDSSQLDVRMEKVKNTIRRATGKNEDGV